jgi:hypothetical protein
VANDAATGDEAGQDQRMAPDAPPAHTIAALNLVLTEDEVRRWVLRWQAAGNGTRKTMETEAALTRPAPADRDPERLAETQRLRELFEREGLEGDRRD